ncbi:PepSY domain-containing protein [Sphingobacterium sp. Mn56C]|uniref:PepSY domain-containing protein n=1 Tax=Sphingobacterium sp. Mn56C TaxID=3395261 RepID=UPI003BED35CA
MTLSIWRYAHLALAIVSSVFLLVLSITGVLLAYDAIEEKLPAYRTQEFNEISVSQVLNGLRNVYPEIVDLSVDHNGFVAIDAFNEEGESIKGYIDPVTGKILGPIKPKSSFIQWITALHRSLFLKETGRILVGVISFILLLITISGVILIIKRQQGVRHFFAKINKEYFSQYFHIVSGRILLIPIIMIALTGTYLFMMRMELLDTTEKKVTFPPVSVDADAPRLAIPDFPIFKEIMLKDVEKIEFPFMEDDPEEYFVIKTKAKNSIINQINGQVVEETQYATATVLDKLSLDLHTGRTNIIWAAILGIASLNIVFFIYTGFVITFKRSRTKIKNKYKDSEAEIIILVGSENGSTLYFANQIYKQLLADGKIAFIGEMNKYQCYPKADHLLLFTSTYGLGTAPSNAVHFDKLLEKYPQDHSVKFSVIGFGSDSYPDFCAYAFHIDQQLHKQSWAHSFLPVYTVNDKSAEQFTQWVQQWSEKSLMPLATAAALYNLKIDGLKKFTVVEKTCVSADNSTFKILLKPSDGLKFQSGDLLAIYPASDNRERFYSIGRKDGFIQLMVKLYTDGFGSSYLYQLEVGQKITARVMCNPNFHFPENTPKVAMIANGTGIAPFLGMVACNSKKTPICLYAGFRNNNSLTQHYKQFAAEYIRKDHLTKFEIALSREEKKQYVMDLLKKDVTYFIDLLENKGTIMICGSLNMQRDVEEILENMSLDKYNKPLSYYKNRKQILSDCY